MSEIKLPECLQKRSMFYKSFPYRFILKRVQVWFTAFMKIFSKTLLDHFENEYEVQIRSVQITGEGQKTLAMLNQDFDKLQFSRHICQMVSCQKLTNKRILDARSYTYDLLDVVCEDLEHEVKLYVFKTHQNVLKNRRDKTNKMCQEKSLAGPSIFNFTKFEIDPKLMVYLKTGLKNVPVVTHVENKLIDELEKEAISACKEMFRSYYGHYPRTSSKKLDTALLGIISQCSSNSKLVGQLSDFRQTFVENLPVFLSSVSQRGLDVKQLIGLIPDCCIITNSDKNVGISILPPEWYEKEYLSQINKGGHELVILSEDECLAQLSNKIREFKSNCSPAQKKLLDSLWPKAFVKHRLGVMKLVPKVVFYTALNAI